MRYIYLGEIWYSRSACPHVFFFNVTVFWHQSTNLYWSGHCFHNPWGTQSQEFASELISLLCDYRDPYLSIKNSDSWKNHWKVNITDRFRQIECLILPHRGKSCAIAMSPIWVSARQKPHHTVTIVIGVSVFTRSLPSPPYAPTASKSDCTQGKGCHHGGCVQALTMTKTKQPSNQSTNQTTNHQSIYNQPSINL